MNHSITAIFFVLLAARAARAHASVLTVSSPLSCRSDFDCKPGNFCAELNGVGICRPKLLSNAPCSSHTNLVTPCAPGLHCAFVGFASPSNRCNPTSGPGRFCSPRNPTACEPPLLCDDTLCRTPRNAAVGAKCSLDADCGPEPNLYCARAGTCARRGVAPAPCDPSLRNFQCVGRCDGRADGTGQCVDPVPRGGACRFDADCAGSLPLTPRSDRVVCNPRAQNGSPGTCVQYSALVRSLGTLCDNSTRQCDFARGLSCRWSPRLRRRVCQHRIAVDTFPERRFCAPGSDLSRCADADTTCRVGRPGTLFGSFAKCMPRTRVVRPGTRCDDEPVRCGEGSQCRAVPGAGNPPGASPFESFDFGTQPSYCMLVRAEGGACWDKFRAQCGAGLGCVKGMCEKMAMPSSVPITHSGVGGVCPDRPCAPGLVCGNGRRCEVRVVRGGWGAKCGITIVNKLECKTGFVCRRWKNGDGPLRCRPPL